MHKHKVGRGTKHRHGQAGRVLPAASTFPTSKVEAAMDVILVLELARSDVCCCMEQTKPETPSIRIHMVADIGYKVRNSSISSTSNSFLRNCRHWLSVAINRLPFKLRVSSPRSLRARSSPQTSERAPTPPPHPAPFIEERVVLHIQSFGPPSNQPPASIATAARPNSLSGDHLVNRRRELHNTD
jgi:hypothetical protein